MNFSLSQRQKPAQKRRGKLRRATPWVASIEGYSIMHVF